MNDSLMLETEYTRMYEVEEKHWWYLGLHDFVFQMLKLIKAHSLKEMTFLDAGCGTGRLLELLKGSFKQEEGIDLSLEALKYCEKRGLKQVQKGSLTKLPYPSQSFDIVSSLDVLYALDDEKQALKEIWRVLKPGGCFIFNLPAYDFLKSAHDAAIQTKRRYTTKYILQELREVGLNPVKVTYRNTILFPLIACLRLIRKGSQAGSDLWMPPAALNKLFLLFLKCENRLIPYMDLPFGLSVCGIAQKKL